MLSMGRFYYCRISLPWTILSWLPVWIWTTKSRSQWLEVAEIELFTYNLFTYYLSHCCYLHSMGQIMKSLFCVSVCLWLSRGHNSHSILMKRCVEVWNPKSKIEFVRGQNPTSPSPTFPQFSTPVIHCQLQGLNTTVLSPVSRLWHSSKDASRRPLHWQSWKIYISSCF